MPTTTTDPARVPCDYRWPVLTGRVTCAHLPGDHGPNGCRACACPVDDTGSETNR